MPNEEANIDEVQKQITFLENNLRKYLSKEALTRYFTIKATKPEFALQISAFVYQAVNQGYIKEKIKDEEFKQLLKKIQEPKKDFKIIK